MSQIKKLLAINEISRYIFFLSKIDRHKSSSLLHALLTYNPVLENTQTYTYIQKEVTSMCHCEKTWCLIVN